MINGSIRKDLAGVLKLLGPNLGVAGHALFLVSRPWEKIILALFCTVWACEMSIIWFSRSLNRLPTSIFNFDFQFLR